MEITYKKTGKEIVLSLRKKEEKLTKQLENYNTKLDEFLLNKDKVKSFLLRWIQGGRSYYDRGKLYGKDELSSEEIEEMGKILSKTRGIQENLTQIKIICRHIDENEEFELAYHFLAHYGFDNK